MLKSISCFLLLFIFFKAEHAFSSNIVNNIVVSQTDQITIKTLNASPYKTFFLSDPLRLVVDIENTVWGITNPIIIPSNNSIKKIRYGIQNGVNLRIVIDLNTKIPEPILVASNSVALPPPLLSATKPVETSLPIIAAKPVSIKPLSQRNNEMLLEESQASKPLLKGKKVKLPIIVIDAGHGGEDPGAIGKFNKTYEKNITLKYAKALKRTLEENQRYKVFLTRTGDYYLPISERVNKARQYKADLFISLHADSHPNPLMKGISIYTLSDKASDKDAELIAIRENSDQVATNPYFNSEPPEVAHLLMDLMRRDTKNTSSSFANLVVNQLGKEMDVIRNTHRFAAFKVLKGPDIPAVLIELGYLSNHEEELLLNSDEHRYKIIYGLVQSIDKHFNKRKIKKESFATIAN